MRGRGHSDDQCPALPQLKQASALAWLVLGMCWGGADGLGEEEVVRKGEAEIRSCGLPKGEGAELVAWNWPIRLRSRRVMVLAVGAAFGGLSHRRLVSADSKQSASWSYVTS